MRKRHLTLYGQQRAGLTCAFAQLDNRIIGAAPCENVSSDICGQRRPRSACASAQSDQDLRCSLTETLDTIECIIAMRAITPDETLPNFDCQ